MKNLVLAATLLGAGLAQGCIISSDDDRGGGGGGGDVKPCDDMELEGGPGACVDVFVNCPVNATTFEITGLGDPVPGDCSIGEKPVVVAPGTYDVVVTPLDDVDEYPSRGETITVEDDEIRELEFTIEAAQMEASWTIAGSPPTELLCSDFSASKVGLTATFATDTSAFESTDFPCEVGSDLTQPLELADYLVVLQLTDADGVPTLEEEMGEPVPQEVSLVDDGQVAVLLEVDLPNP